MSINALVLAEVEITDEDRKTYPYFKEDSIRSIKIVDAQSTDFLLDCVAYTKRGRIDWTNKDLTALAALLTSPLNPRWLMARIAEALLMRDAITNEDYNRIDDEC